MLDLASTLNVGIGVLSAMFGCRALGGGVGSVGAGVAMDKLTNYSYTMLASIILSSILSEFLSMMVNSCIVYKVYDVFLIAS